MRKIKWGRLLVAVFMATVLILPYFAPDAKAVSGTLSVYKLARDRVRIRTHPTSDNPYNIIKTLSKGTRMIKIGSSGRWYKVVTEGGITGYIFSDPYLTYYGAVSASSVAYTTTSVRVRAKASSSSKKKASLSKNSLAVVKKYNSTWAEIQTLRGVKGYVMTKYLKKAF